MSEPTFVKAKVIRVSVAQVIQFLQMFDGRTVWKVLGLPAKFEALDGRVMSNGMMEFLVKSEEFLSVSADRVPIVTLGFEMVAVYDGTAGVFARPEKQEEETHEKTA